MAAKVEHRTALGSYSERKPASVGPALAGHPERIVGAVIALQAVHWLGAGLNHRLVPSTRAGRTIGRAAGGLGRGLVAGLAGTVAITLAAAADQWVRERMKAAPVEPRPPFNLFRALIGPWVYAADVVGKVLGGVTPVDERAKERLALAAHVSYGTVWGTSLAALDLTGIRGPGAMLIVLGGQLGTEMLAMPAANFFPPVTQWGRTAIISSTYQHALYAVAAGLTFDFLSRDA